MDNISEGMSLNLLRCLFEKYGYVEDVFISKKPRKHKLGAFGFVRLTHLQDARMAKNYLNGFVVCGSKLTVSLAKYNKDGSIFKNQNSCFNGCLNQPREIKKPSFRDHRKDSDVLIGKQKVNPNVNNDLNIIPICFTVNAIENVDTVKMLDKAVIAENSEVIHLKQAEIEVLRINNSVRGIFSLSPTKILIVFKTVDDVVYAASVNSAFWSVFDDFRLWSEGDNFDDRLVWLECYGIHPKCWTMDNVRKIGEHWGPVLSIENRIDDVCSLTYARLLVRTKGQN